MGQMLHKLSFQFNDSITGRSQIFMVLGDISSIYRVYNALRREGAVGFEISAEVRPILPGGDLGEVTYSQGVLLGDDRKPPC